MRESWIVISAFDMTIGESVGVTLIDEFVNSDAQRWSEDQTIAYPIPCGNRDNATDLRNQAQIYCVRFHQGSGQYSGSGAYRKVPPADEMVLLKLLLLIQNLESGQRANTYSSHLLCLSLLHLSPKALAIQTHTRPVPPATPVTIVKHQPAPTALISGCKDARAAAASVQRTMLIEA